MAPNQRAGPSDGLDTLRSHSLGSRYLSSSPLAEQSLAEDIAACSDDDFDEDLSRSPRSSSHHRIYRRLSGVAYGPSRPVFNSQGGEDSDFTPLARMQSRDAERSLLRDNHILPPKHNPQEKSQTLVARLYRRLFSTKVQSQDPEADEAVEDGPSETSPLLNERSNGYPESPGSDSDDVDKTWEQAVLEGRIKTTWQREAKTVASYSGPLIVTFFLQYSINVASIFAVGHIGRIELGAVSCECPPMHILYAYSLPVLHASKLKAI